MISIDSKEYLQQAFELNKLIKAKQLQIQYLRDMQENVSYTLLPDRVQANSRNDRLSEISAVLLDLIDSYATDVTRLLAIKYNVKAIIESVRSHKHRCLLSLRYESFMTWDEIAEEMHYDCRWVYRLHNKAIEAIKRHYIL